MTSALFRPYIELCRHTSEEIRAAARRDAFNLKQGMKALFRVPAGLHVHAGLQLFGSGKAPSNLRESQHSFQGFSGCEGSVGVLLSLCLSP